MSYSKNKLATLAIRPINKLRQFAPYGRRTSNLALRANSAARRLKR